MQSFVTVATNKTIKTTNVTPVADKHCIGTVRLQVALDVVGAVPKFITDS